MLKKVLSIVLLTAMLVTNFSQALVFANEPAEKKEETIEEKEEGGETSVEKSDKSEEDAHTHSLVYEMGLDGTHLVTCSEEDCDYSESEDCVLEEGRCNKCGYSEENKEEQPESEPEDVIEEPEEDEKESEIKLFNTELNQVINGYNITAAGMMPESAELSVTEIEETEDIEERVNENISDDLEYHVYAAFDIDILVNGEKWQPVDFDELVKISIAGLDIEEAKENITYNPGDIISDVIEEAVYRVEDNSVTELESVVTDEEIVFDTEHFTVFTVGGVSYNTNNGTCVFDTSKTYTLHSNETNTQFTANFNSDPAVKIYWFSDTKTLFWDYIDSNPPYTPTIKSGYGMGYGTEGTSYAFKASDYNPEVLVFGEGFKQFHSNSFEGYTTIKKIVLPSTVELINNSCFRDCTALETVDLSKVTTRLEVGISAFYDCSSLKSCVLPATTKYINDKAFDGCRNLETIGEALPPNLEMIGSFALAECSKLKITTTLPDSLMYFNSFRVTGTGLRSENVVVTGTLPANLKIFCCVWNNSLVHFAGLRQTKLRGDIPAGVEKIGGQMFYVYDDIDIEDQTYFSRNLSNVEITGGMDIPAKYIIEDRVGSATGTLLGSNEYLGCVGDEYHISGKNKKWNSTEVIKYEGYSVKDDSATVIPVLDAQGTVAKAVRIWQKDTEYFYLKVFKNGIAGELDGEITLVDSSEDHPLSLTAEYVDNGIYKVGFNPADITKAPYYYGLQIYLDGVKLRDLYSRRILEGGGTNRPLVTSLCAPGYWYDAYAFYHRDKATGKYTYNLPLITNAEKMSDVKFSELDKIDFTDVDDNFIVNGFSSYYSGVNPYADYYYYIDLQDWAFAIDANTGTFEDGTTRKYVEFSGKDDNRHFTNGMPEEPTKEGYIFADWESHTLNNPILPDWYGAGKSSEDVIEWAYNPYYGNTHTINLSDIEGDHLEDKAYLHYIDDESEVVVRYAKYRPIITLNANGGVFANGEEVYETTLKDTSRDFNCIDKPANPTKEGHTFAGYTPSNDFINNNRSFMYQANTPTEYTATWNINHFYIYFNQGGGSYVSPQYIAWGSKATKPADPTRSGYTFMGWYTDSTYTTPVDWDNDTYKETTTLYPLYKKSPFVTFNSNGGSAIGSRYVDYMSKLSKPEDPTRGGYTFTKWYKDSGLTNEYDFNTVLTEDIDLYAGWDANTYTITYDYAGGSVDSSNRTSYKPTDSSFVLSDAKKAHHTFTGYTVENDVSGGWSVTVPRGSLSVPKGTYGNLTVTANFTEKPMQTVTFDLGYVGSTPFTQKVYYGEAVVKPDDPVREGYFFKCWKNETGIELTELSPAVYRDITYTAVWIKSYAITFDANGGTYPDGTSAVTLYTDAEGHVSYIPRASKPAWEPTGGWMHDPVWGSGVMYDLTTDFSMWGRDYTLYTQYRRKVFNINYMLNGGTTATTLYTGYDGSLAVELPDDVTKEGYYFIGWTVENDGADGATFSIDEPQMGAVIPEDTYGNLTARANYIKKNDVTVNANGGKFNDGTEVKHVVTDVDGKIDLPEDPTREGYIFKGWEIDGKDYDPNEDVITEDTELKAKWEIIKVTITFVSQDEVVETKTYNYGDEIAAPTVRREGCTFTGWTPQYVGVAKNDTTYTANWRVKSYRVKFIDHNGNVISNKTYTYGSKVEEPENPSRTGYRFIGWSPRVEEVCTGNAEYKATYNIMTYTVSFVDYDGKEISNNTYTYGDTVVIPASPTINGYFFTGWDKNVNTTATEDAVYKAKYGKIEVKYTVTFADQNGYVINSREYSLGEKIYVPDAPKRKGYEFTGWTPKVANICEGAALYKATYDRDVIEEPEKPEEEKYLITFAGYNGQIISSGNYKAGEPVNIPNAPEIDGYNFRNWYPAVEAKATKSVTYTAVYDAKPQKIEEPKPKPEPKKEKEEEEEPEEVIEEKPSDNEKPDEIPKKKKFTVVFKDSDGKVISRKVYDEGDEIEIPKAPEKEGYTFKGWSPSISKKADKNTEYKTIYIKTQVEVKPEPVEEKKPVKISKTVKRLIAGAACVGILTAGYFSGVWLLLLNLLFIGRRKKWKGILTEEDNKYIKAVRNLDDETANIKDLFDDLSGDVNTFMDAVSILKSYTVLPFGTKMFVTLADNKGSDVRSFEEADEKTFYDLLADNLSQDMRVILNLVNERCDVNIEIEFSLDKKEPGREEKPKEKVPAFKAESDGTLEFLDEEDLPDYS